MNSPILKGITWDHPRGYDPLVASSALYEKLFGVTVKWEKRSLTNFGGQSLSELTNHFDLLIIDHPHAGVAHETKCLFPLDELLPGNKLNELEKQSAGPVFSSYNYKGKQLAMPVDAAVQSAAVRMDLLDELVIPKDWNAVFELADLLKKKNLHVGMALCPTDSLCSFLTITAQLGSPIREGNEILVNPDVGLQSLELMRKMRDSFHQNSLDWNPIQLYDHMSTQDDIVYSPLAFCYTNYSRDGFRKNKLSYGNAPGVKNAVLGGAGIAISAKSKYLNEAAQYITWICSAEIQNSVYVLEQGQPANIIAWQSDFANMLTHDFFFNTIDTLAKAFVRPRYRGWLEFQKCSGEVIHAYLKDDTDPAKVLDHLQEAYRQSYLNNK
jgi:multiple sugar transport system substrate-binding protein